MIECMSCQLFDCALKNLNQYFTDGAVGLSTSLMVRLVYQLHWWCGWFIW